MEQLSLHLTAQSLKKGISLLLGFKDFGCSLSAVERRWMHLGQPFSPSHCAVRTVCLLTHSHLIHTATPCSHRERATDSATVINTQRKAATTQRENISTLVQNSNSTCYTSLCGGLTLILNKEWLTFNSCTTVAGDAGLVQIRSELFLYLILRGEEISMQNWPSQIYDLSKSRAKHSRPPLT